jgi:hypothetical protein
MKKLFTLLFLLTAFISNAQQNTLNKLNLTSGTPASVAYSLRLLSNSYTGPLVRIKVVNSFYDVYPDESTTKFSLSSKISAAIGTFNAAVAAASTNALSTIITGSINATVAIWYDQSGNNKHTYSSDQQAKIIISGSIKRLGLYGNPTIDFSPNLSFLKSATTVNYSAQTGATVNAVAQNTDTYFGGIIGTAKLSNPGYNISYGRPSGQGYMSDGAGGYYQSGVNTFDPKLITSIFNDKTQNVSKIYVNSVLTTDIAGSASKYPLDNSSGSYIFIGVARDNNTTQIFKGNISEAIIFPKQLTAEEQSLLETNQNAFYFSGSVSISSSASGAICPGTNVTFTSDISNFTNTPSFQWYKNNVILSGETSATYSTTGLNNNDVIKVIAGGATSNELIATITAGPSISVLGDGCINKTTLTTPTGATAYSWYKDNVAISNTNSSTYAPTTAGDYKVQVTNGSCATQSTATTISTCGVTADGKMLALTNAVSLLSTEGGANFGTAIDDMGRITNTTGLTTTVGTIDGSTAVLGGVISSTNGIASSVGVIYSTDLNFGTYSTATIQTNVAAGTYTSTISGLSSSTSYYAKSFIINKAGTSYGTVINFTTPTVVPSKVAVTRASVGRTYGAVFTTQPQVTIQTASGSTVTNSSETVTASINSGGALIGTKSVNAVNGVATFTNLGLKGMNGTAYTITYTVSGLTTATESVTPTGSWSLGATGPGGGKIFYVNTSGFACGPTLSETCYYLEVAPSSAQASRHWAQSGFTGITVPNGARETAIGTGYKNTVAIIAQGNNDAANSAAAYAQAYGGSDWYLPSTLELKELATKYSSFSSDATFTGAPAVSWEWWTSTEASSNQAYTVRISDNGGPWANSKSSNPVRPIRSF